MISKVTMNINVELQYMDIAIIYLLENKIESLSPHIRWVIAKSSEHDIARNTVVIVNQLH